MKRIILSQCLSAFAARPSDIPERGLSLNRLCFPIFLAAIVAVLVASSLPAESHNWHAEFSTLSGSGPAGFTSPYASSTGASGGNFAVTFNGGLPSNWLSVQDGILRFDVGGTSCRGRFAATHAMNPAAGISVGFRLQMDNATITRGPIQLTVFDGATPYNCYVRYNNSTITILQNGGAAHSGINPYSLSMTGMNNWCLAVKVGGGYAHWNLWINGNRIAFSGTDGNHTYDGVTYSFRTPSDGFTAIDGRGYIGLGELHTQSGWAFRYDWVRWTDQGAVYFGDPYFHTNPTSQTKYVGETATFSAETWHGETPSYQWQIRPSGGSWSNISGATSTSYTTPTLTDADNGNQFRLRATRSGYPHVYSEVVTLTILCTPPSITAQPVDLEECVGETALFSVTASGSELSYQWRKNGASISGATNATYTIPSVAVTDAASYDCVITNACGSVTSNAATLTVNTAPSITLHPIGALVTEGDNVTLMVEAEGTGPISYQWRKNEVDIAGAVNAVLAINDARIEDSGVYDCVVSNPYGCSVTSEAAVLTVEPPLHPLGMSNILVGGSDWHYDPATGAGQKGITDAVGLGNIGSLVRVWGAFTYIDHETFTIDDGSGVVIRCSVPSTVELDPAWAFVTVTGISSCYKENDDLQRLILVRVQDDIQVVSP